MNETLPTPRGLSPFEAKVAAAVRAIPPGQTASYAKVALMAGKPGAARAVVRALRAVDHLPWWRVVRADGTLAPEVALEQSMRLEKEGVEVRGRRIVRASKLKGRAPRTG